MLKVVVAIRVATLAGLRVGLGTGAVVVVVVAAAADGLGCLKFSLKEGVGFTCLGGAEARSLPL